MANNTQIVIATLIIIIAILGIAAGYLYYDNMQKEKEAQQQQMEELERQLNQTQDELKELNESKSSSSSSSSGSSKASSSSGNKVTYEEAGVNKNIGYMKTCKYPGCGARYDSRLSYCPKCGQRNIYV